MSKSVLGFSLHKSLIAHSAVALASALSGLQSPVVASSARIGICTFRACLLLNVVGLISTSPASTVDLCMSFTETLSTFTSCHRLYK